MLVSGCVCPLRCVFFNDTATTEIYTLSLHDALPIYHRRAAASGGLMRRTTCSGRPSGRRSRRTSGSDKGHLWRDRKSTRLNSSHITTSYAVFCLKKKNETESCPRPHCKGQC